MQFFAVFGSYGLMGMLLAVLMLLLLSCLVMKIATEPAQSLTKSL